MEFEVAIGKNLLVSKHPGLEFSQVFGYPQSCAVEAGGLIFCSGMVAVNPVTGEREHGTVTSESRRIFENLKILLEENGSDLARIVQVHAMIYSRLEYDVLDKVFSPRLMHPTHDLKTIFARRARSFCEAPASAV